MNIRPVKKPLLEEEGNTHTIQGTPSLEWISGEIEKNPNDIGFRFGKTRRHMKDGNWKEAREELETILFMDPEQKQAWQYLALTEKMLGNQEGTARCYEKLEALNYFDQETLCEHGKALLRIRRYAEAKELFDQALEYDETCADAWVGRSEALRSLLTPVLSHDPKPEVSPEEDKEIVQGYEKALESKPDSLPALHGIVEWSICRGREKEGMNTIDTALDIDPSSSRSLEQKGRLLESMGSEAASLDAYKKSTEFPASNAELYEPTALYSRANAFEKVGDADGSLRCLEKIIDIDRTNQQALMKRAELLMAMGKTEEAAEAYEALVNLRPRDHYLWHLKGNAEKEAKQHDKAISSFDMSLAQKPDFIPAICSKSETFYRIGRLEEGKDVVEELLSMDPGNTDGLKLRALIQQAMEKRGKKMDTAHPSEEPEKRKCPSDMKQVLQRARDAFDAGNPARALREISMGQESAEKDWETLSLIGDCHASTGNGDEAIRAYKKAASLNPTNASLYTSAARVQFGEGDLFSALDTIRSCPVKDDQDMVRAEIEIEAEILVANIRDNMGVMGNIRQKERPKQERDGGNAEKTTNVLKKRIQEKVRRKKEKTSCTSDDKAIPATREHLLELKEKIERSLGETPSDDMLWYARSFVSHQLGETRSAILSMERAIWLKPTNKRYLEAMSELMTLLGQKSKADTYRKRAEELGEKQENCKEAQRTFSVAPASASVLEGKECHPSTPECEEENSDMENEENLDEWSMTLIREWKREIEDTSSETVDADTEPILAETAENGTAEKPTTGAPGAQSDLFHCPNCDSTFMRGVKSCENCKSRFNWENTEIVDEVFFDDLFFFGMVRESLMKGEFSHIYFDFMNGRVNIIIPEEDATYRIECWRYLEETMAPENERQVFSNEIMKEDCISIMEQRYRFMTSSTINGVEMDRDLEMLLRAVMRKPSSAKELSKQCDVPIAKCYRGLDAMEKAGLLKKERVATIPIYSITVEQVSIEIDDISAKLRLRTILDLSESVEHRVMSP